MNGAVSSLTTDAAVPGGPPPTALVPRPHSFGAQRCRPLPLDAAGRYRRPADWPAYFRACDEVILAPVLPAIRKAEAVAKVTAALAAAAAANSAKDSAADTRPQKNESDQVGSTTTDNAVTGPASAVVAAVATNLFPAPAAATAVAPITSTASAAPSAASSSSRPQEQPSWRTHEAQLAAYIADVIAGRRGVHEAELFCQDEHVRAKHCATLAQLDAGLVDFVEQTALADTDALVAFAARFPPPWHAVAHVVVLAPLVHSRLRSLLAGNDEPLFGYALPLDLIAEIEVLQQERIAHDRAKQVKWRR